MILYMLYCPPLYSKKDSSIYIYIYTHGSSEAFIVTVYITSTLGGDNERQ